MPQVINTNIAGINAQRQLNKSQYVQNEAMERLASGLRINSAKDDAAGLAISTGMSSQVKGLNQAIRNANDGISMLQTAEGSMDEMTNILQRMRELSIQAANDSNSTSNRASIQAELDQLHSELQRISETTQFNGVNLLDGSANSTTLQIGANASENLSFQLDSLLTKDLNLNAVSEIGELNSGRVDLGTLAADAIAVNGIPLSGGQLGTAVVTGTFTGGVDNDSGLTAAMTAQLGALGVNHFVAHSPFGNSANTYDVANTTDRHTDVNRIGGSGITSGLEINGITIPNSTSLNDLATKIAGATGYTTGVDAGGLFIQNGDFALTIGGNVSGIDKAAGTYGPRIHFDLTSDLTITGSSDILAIAGLLPFYDQSVASMVVGPPMTGGVIPANSLTFTDGGGTVTFPSTDISVGSFTTTYRPDSLTFVERVNEKTGEHGVIASGYNILEGEAADGVTDGNLIINGVTLDKTGSMSELVDAINLNVPRVEASVLPNGVLRLSNDSGDAIEISGAGSSNSGLIDGTYSGYLSLTSANGEEITVEYDEDNGGSAAMLQLMGFNSSVGSDHITSGSISGTNITSDDAIYLNGVELGPVGNVGNGDATAAQISTAINKLTDHTGVMAEASTEVKYSISVADFATDFGTAGDLLINGVQVTGLSADVTSMGDVIHAINSAGIAGLNVSADTAGRLVLSINGQNITVESATAGVFVDASGSAVAANTATTTRGSISLEGIDGRDIHIESKALTESLRDSAMQKLGLTDQGGHEKAFGSGLNVYTVAGAENAIERIDEALAKISSVRGNLGALQNRLTSTISNLSNVSQNLNAANSRIKDADFAIETSKMAKSQIIQQAGTSILAQANNASQNILSLLG